MPLNFLKAVRRRAVRHKIIALPALACLAAASWQPAFAGDLGWIIQQKSDRTGKRTLYLSSQGIKVLDRAMNTIVPASGQKVTLYNERTRSYFQLPYADWCKKYVNPPATGLKLEKAKSGKIAGVESTQYLCRKQSGKQALYPDEYWLASAADLPPHLLDALARIANMPAATGIPLRIYKADASGKQVLDLDTIVCERKAVTTATFTLPPGYKPVKDAMTLVLGKNTSAEKELDDAVMK
jgi:hypothetical protein